MVGTNGHAETALDALKRLRDRKAADEAAATEKLEATSRIDVVEVLAPRETVAARLERKYGLGEDAKKRRDLYRRVQACVELHGDDALGVVNSVVADAERAGFAARYFCKAVMRRLREARLGDDGSKGGDASW
jgi:hypothetical protein